MFSYLSAVREPGAKGSDEENWEWTHQNFLLPAAKTSDELDMERQLIQESDIT